MSIEVPAKSIKVTWGDMTFDGKGVAINELPSLIVDDPQLVHAVEMLSDFVARVGRWLQGASWFREPYASNPLDGPTWRRWSLFVHAWRRVGRHVQPIEVDVGSPIGVHVGMTCTTDDGVNYVVTRVDGGGITLSCVMPAPAMTIDTLTSADFDRMAKATSNEHAHASPTRCTRCNRLGPPLAVRCASCNGKTTTVSAARDRPRRPARRPSQR